MDSSPQEEYFMGCAKVLMEGSLPCRRVDELKRGDMLVNGAEVLTIVERKNFDGPLVHVGGMLVTTPNQPVTMQTGASMRACDVPGCEEFDLEPLATVYNIVLIRGNCIYISDGSIVTTMGTGMRTPSTQHAFYGTEQCVEALKNMAGWEEGRVQVGARLKTQTLEKLPAFTTIKTHHTTIPT